MKKVAVMFTAMFFLVGLMWGCSSLTGSGKDDVSAKITASEIIVSNDSDEPVYVFAVGKTIQPLILWAPSLQDEQRVGAHQKRTFARDASVIADKESRATVYWWVSVVKNGVAEPGPIQSFDVSVP